MSMQSPVLFFSKHFKEKDKTAPTFDIKRVVEGITTTHKIPICRQAPFDTNEDLLNTVRQFNRAAERLDWTDDQCHEHFENCLAGIAASDWEAVLSALPKGEIFSITKDEFIEQIIPDPHSFTFA